MCGLQPVALQTRSEKVGGTRSMQAPTHSTSILAQEPCHGQTQRPTILPSVWWLDQWNLQQEVGSEVRATHSAGATNTSRVKERQVPEQQATAMAMPRGTQSHLSLSQWDRTEQCEQLRERTVRGCAAWWARSDSNRRTKSRRPQVGHPDQKQELLSLQLARTVLWH